MDRMDSDPVGTFQVQFPVVDEDTLLGAMLGHVDGNPVDLLLGLLQPEKARRQEQREVPSQSECFDPIIVQFTRFVVKGRQQVSPEAARSASNASESGIATD